MHSNSQTAIAERLAVEQISAIARASVMFAVLSLVAANLIALSFWDDSTRTFLCTSVLMLAVVHGAAVSKSRRWLANASGNDLPRFGKVSRTVIVGLIALVWGGMLVGLEPRASISQQQLITCAGTGLISTGIALASLLPAALLFTGIITASMILSALLSHDTYAVQNAMQLLLFGIMSCAITLRQHKEFCERVKNELQMEEQSQLIGLLLRDFEENASEFLWETNNVLELCRVSEHMARATDMPASLLNGRSLLNLMPVADTDLGADDRVLQLFTVMASSLAERRPFRDQVFPVKIDGNLRWWSLTGKPMIDKAGVFVGYRGVGSDVTQAKLSEERIAYLAQHDSLTELPNRSLFHDTLAKLCAQPGAVFAVMFLDLDGFKAINDTLGHATGDALLIAIASRLRAAVREGDMIARLGGDEFAVIQVGGTTESAALLGTRLTTRVSDSYHLNGVPVTIGVSIGITLSGLEGTDPNQLLREADLALYSAKENGRGMWRFFETEMGERADARHNLLADLRHAVSLDQLTLHFQPILDLDTHEVVCAEALLRWNHPELGLIPPNDFIPLCEESGLIVPIGAWVLRRACAEAATWRKPIRVAVNLSPVQFHDPCFLLTVDEALNESHLDPERLELEITESLFIDASQQNIEILHHLRDRGIRIALDDFGTGYSALSYLRSFPFDRVKIDRSFVRELGDNPESTAIVKAITGMATSLGMKTTAEGVETAEQADLLRDSGCGQVQGFLYSRPCPPSEVAQYIARSNIALLQNYGMTASD